MVDREQPRQDHGAGEGEGALETAIAKPPPKGLVFEYGRHRRSDLIRILGIHLNCGITRHLGEGRPVRGYDRRATGHGLYDRQSEPFGQRGEDKDSFDVRVFDDIEATTKNITVTDYDSFDAHPELILYEGWYDLESRTVQLEVKKTA